MYNLQELGKSLFEREREREALELSRPYCRHPFIRTRRVHLAFSLHFHQSNEDHS